MVLSSLSWIPRVFFLFLSIKKESKNLIESEPVSLQSQALSRKPLRSSYESVYVPPFFFLYQQSSSSSSVNYLQMANRPPTVRLHAFQIFHQ